jgi:hypothetical protein
MQSLTFASARKSDWVRMEYAFDIMLILTIFRGSGAALNQIEFSLDSTSFFFFFFF